MSSSGQQPHDDQDRQDELLEGISEVLDGSEQTSSAAPSGCGAEELADQAFVTGALQYLLGDSEGHVDRLIGRAMGSIDGREGRGRMLRYSWLPLAAGLMLVVFFNFRERPKDLLAAVNRVVAAVQRDIDREYVVELDNDRLPPYIPQPPKTRLYLRGKTHMVARLELMRFGPASAGFDGKQFWIVPPSERSPVLVFKDQASMEDFTKKWGLFLDSMQLANLLDRVTIDYEIGLTKGIRSSPGQIDFTGVRRPTTASFRPATIRIVAEEETGRLVKMVVAWGEERRRLAPSLMTVKLVEERRQPDAFYKHEAHHEPGRPVRVRRK